MSKLMKRKKILLQFWFASTATITPQRAILCTLERNLEKNRPSSPSFKGRPVESRAENKKGYFSGISAEIALGLSRSQI